MIYSRVLVFLQFSIIFILVFFSKGFFSNIFYILLFLIGAGVGIWAILHNKRDNFYILPEMRENAKLITTGPYRYIRHPMYFSVLLMMLPFVLATKSALFWILYVILIVVLYLKAIKEESLWQRYRSKEYTLYKNKTKAIIPFIL